jgi:hypothetical protein
MFMNHSPMAQNQINLALEAMFRSLIPVCGYRFVPINPSLEASGFDSRKTR